jgi:uncharacterized protein
MVKLAVRERESTALTAWVKGHQLFSSALSRVELHRALRRSGGVVQHTADEIFAGVGLVAIDQDVLSSAASLDPAALGTLDAIHLATALILAPDVERFVTYDVKLARAASRAGRSVESPH